MSATGSSRKTISVGFAGPWTTGDQARIVNEFMRVVGDEASLSFETDVQGQIQEGDLSTSLADDPVTKLAGTGGQKSSPQLNRELDLSIVPIGTSVVGVPNIKLGTFQGSDHRSSDHYLVLPTGNTAGNYRSVLGTNFVHFDPAKGQIVVNMTQAMFESCHQYAGV